MRADARRNRDRILAAARDLVTETGTEATVDDIARRAGLAVGTLYRHFPAKEDLVEAVVEDSLERVAALAAEAAAAPGPPGDALLDLFRRLAREHATDRTFKAAAGRLDPGAEIATAAPGSAVARSAAAVTDLLVRAQAAGEVRGDVTLADLTLLLAGVPGPEVGAAARERFVDVVAAGLRAPAPPPRPAAR
jgi:AcrR family transcriptional regulator